MNSRDDLMLIPGPFDAKAVRELHELRNGLFQSNECPLFKSFIATRLLQVTDSRHFRGPE